jgi:hypothetical protein
VRPPLRPRFLYLAVWGPWPFPLYLALPLFLLEWGLLLFLWKTRGLLRGRPGPRVPFLKVFALRGLPPTPLLSLEAEGVQLKVGLW